MGEVSSGDAEKEEEQESCHQQDGSSRNEGAVTTGTKVILGIEYRGELHNGKREGFGVQKWPNGCRYEGYFHNDTRHGQGKHWWPNGEVYEGEYQNDRRHGYGTYMWPGGAVFTGYFRNDKKDGKGTFHSEHGETFEGTYQDGVRSGEGVLTYPGCRQDVGIWCGSRLVQLKFAVHEAASPLHAGSRVLHTPDLASRGDHMPKGPLETASQDLILAACAGNLPHLRALTCSGVVHIDVVDRLGYSALFAAVLHGQVEVVQFLLNEGADVNRLATDTQYSPLSACCHLLYHPRVGHTKYHLHSLQGGGTDTSSTSEYTVLTEDMFSRTPSILTPSSRAVEWSPQVGEACMGVSQRGALPQRRRCLSCSSTSDKAVLLHNLAQQLSRAGVGKDEGRRSKRHSIAGTPAAQECWARRDSTDVVPHWRVLTPSAPQSRLQLPSLPSLPQSRGSLLAALSAKQPSGAASLSPQEATGTQSVSSTGDDWPRWAEPRCPTTTTCYPSHMLTDASMILPISHSDSKLSSTLEHEPNLAQRKGSRVNTDAGEIPLELALSRNPHLVTTPNSTLSTPTFPGWTKQVTRLNSSKVFSSTHFGTILSAAQSTNILCSEGDSEGEEEEEEEATVPYLTPVGTASPNQLQDNRRVEAVIDALLSRGADPNITTQPLPPLHYAILARDMDSPHGGWTPLHIACSCELDTSRAASAKIVPLLLKHGANPNLIACGHSPLSLAIMHGLDEVVELLLEHGADVGLPLGPGVGTALCAVATHEALLHYSHSTAVALVMRLMSHGANLFQSVPLFRDRSSRGTVVDHAHQQLTRGRHLRDFPPNSNLLMSTRSGKTKMAALQMLVHHLGTMLKEELRKSIYLQLGQQRRRQIAALKRRVCPPPLSSAVRPNRAAGRSTSASNSVPIPVPHLNWEMKTPPNIRKCPLPSQKTTSDGQPLPSCSDTDYSCSEQAGTDVVAKELSNFCYECGRHAGVHLAPCSTCSVVHYCSKKCQKRSWSKEHCLECHCLRQSQRTATKTSTKAIVSGGSSRPKPSLPTEAIVSGGSSRPKPDMEACQVLCAFTHLKHSRNRPLLPW